MARKANPKNREREHGHVRLRLRALQSEIWFGKKHLSLSDF